MNDNKGFNSFLITVAILQSKSILNNLQYFQKYMWQVIYIDNILIFVDYYADNLITLTRILSGRVVFLESKLFIISFTW